MKHNRIIAILLSFVLVFSLAAPAFADEVAPGGDAEVQGSEVATTVEEGSPEPDAEASVDAPEEVTTLEEEPPLTDEFDTPPGEIPEKEVGSPDNYVSNEMIVVFADSEPLDTQLDVLAEELDSYAHEAVGDDVAGEQSLSTFSADELVAYELEEDPSSEPTVLVELPDELSVAQGVAIAEELPGVVSAQPNYLLYPIDDEIESQAVPDDPYSKMNQTGGQWSLYKTGAFSAWDYPAISSLKTIQEGATTTVAVIDTGARLDHADLALNLDTARAWDVVNNRLLKTTVASGAHYGDVRGHGTMVSGFISAVANNGIGVAGITNNKVKVLPISIYAQGSATAKTTDLIKAIDKVIEYNGQGANIRVINLSIGGYFTNSKGAIVDVTYEQALDLTSTLHAKIAEAEAKGITVIAAAGNEGDDSKYMPSGSANAFIYPSDYEEVISVTSTDINDAISPSSDHNQYKDIAAPGVSVASTHHSGSYSSGGGTSYASPLVAGTAALLMAIDEELTPAGVKDLLYKNSVDLGAAGRDDYYGWGRLDVAETIRDASLQLSSPIDIQNAIIAPVSSQTYTGKAITPYLDIKYNEISMVRDKDYSVRYSSNTNAGTATVTVEGMRHCTGTSKITFTIKPAQLAQKSIASIGNQQYTGSAVKPTPTVTHNGVKLTKDKDYAISYKNNVNVGTATLTITGKGNYTGTASTTYSISRDPIGDYDGKIITIYTRLGINQVIDVPNATTDSWVNLNTWSANNTVAQRYRVVAQRNSNNAYTGYFSLTNIKSGKAFDVQGGAAVAGAGVHQYNQNNSNAQLFKLKASNETGYCYITSKINEKYTIEVQGGSTQNGARIQLGVLNNSSSQKFRFDVVKPLSTLKDGIYTLTSANSGCNLDAAGSETTWGTNIYQAAPSHLNSQRFSITYDVNTGYYKILSAYSKRALDAPNSSTIRGANIQLGNDEYSLAQRWRPVLVPGTLNTYVFYNVYSNLVLDVSGGSMLSGGNVNLWSYNGSPAQQWRLSSSSLVKHSINTSMAKNLNGKVITLNTTFAPNGVTQVVDVPNATTESWVNLNSWNANNTSAQRYRVVSERINGNYTGYFSLINVKSGKAFDVQGGLAVKGAGVHQYRVNGTKAQLFYAVNTEDANKSVYLISAMNPDFCLDIAGGNPQNGSRVQIWTWNRSQAQKFILSEIKPLAGLQNGTYVLWNHNSSRCLEVSSTASGGNVQQGPLSASSARQRFEIKFDTTTGYYTFSNNNLVFNVPGASTARGSNVQLGTLTGSMAQYYYPIQIAANTYIFRNVNSNLVLDVSGGLTSAGANVQQWSANGSRAQSWVVQKVG